MSRYEVELYSTFKSDLYWMPPHHDANYYKHPEGKPVFDVTGGKKRESLSQPGVFADCEDVKEVEALLAAHPLQGCCILVKGSNSMKLSELPASL